MAEGFYPAVGPFISHQSTVTMLPDLSVLLPFFTLAGRAFRAHHIRGISLACRKRSIRAQ